MAVGYNLARPGTLHASGEPDSPWRSSGDLRGTFLSEIWRTLLAVERVEARRARLEQFRTSGRALRAQPAFDEPEAELQGASEIASDPAAAQPGRVALNRLLLMVEVGAVVGLALIVWNGLRRPAGA